MKAECGLCNSTMTKIFEKELVVGKEEYATKLNLKYIECDECGESFYTKESESVINKTVSDIKRKKQGLLLGEEIKAFRKSLGVTQEQLSIMLGMAPKTISRYEGGFAVQSKQTDEHLRLMISNRDRAIEKAIELNFLEDCIEIFPVRKHKNIYKTKTRENHSNCGSLAFCG
ncbi:type II TA system antitoxin MqsA family protein [Geovibrio thiophilus]|nr:type II TA system antitoxin MqsA family protein [Geovibrio thiophilus]